MRNPVVVTKTGRTYEKVAIEAWITLNHSEPYDGRVQLTNFHDAVLSNKALYALIDHFVRSVRTMEPGALLDGTVTQRMKRAAAKTTVVVVERKRARQKRRRFNQHECRSEDFRERSDSGRPETERTIRCLCVPEAAKEARRSAPRSRERRLPWRRHARKGGTRTRREMVPL